MTLIDRMRTLLAPLALALAVSTTVPAAAQGRCSQDVFAIDGQSVTVSVCAGPADNGSVALNETYATRSTSFSHGASVALVNGAVSRVTEDVALNPLGISRSLHLTVAYRDGRAWIESALLRPGAIPLK